MKCNVCGHGWHASESCCPRCGSATPPDKKRFYRELFWMILLALFVFWLTRHTK
jgi:hypothetical protein